MMTAWSAYAQTADELNDGLRVTNGAQQGDFTLSWWGTTGRTYFVQQSFDLMTWQYVPVVICGEGDVCGLNFTCTDPRQFWRLFYTDMDYTASAEDADFDGDGLTNLEEVVTYHTDPFEWDTDEDWLSDREEVHIYSTSPTLPDTDGDGMNDGLETWYDLDPTSAIGSDGSAGDPDNDGLTNLQELTVTSTDPHDADCDDDTLSDGEELLVYGTSPLNADSDFDGLSDADEINLYATDPNAWDSDGDGLPDGWEATHSLDPKSAAEQNGATGDPDGDMLDNLNEYAFYTDPHDADSDDDTLSDRTEVMVFHTDPNAPDTDQDGLDDADEVLVYFSDPLNNDTDDDTLPDGEEVHSHGTDPVKMDSDGDWMWDDWELAHGFDPLSAADAWLDADNDGLSNVTEFLFQDEGYDPHAADASGFDWQADPDHDGLTNQQELQTYLTNPAQPDTDGDTLDDGWEIEYGMSATVNNNTDAITGNDSDDDPDGDHLDNEMECQLGTDPFDADTDADGVNDDVEDAQATNPNNAASSTPPLNGTIEVEVRIGDPSDSHSERYEVRLTPVEGDSYGGDRTRKSSGFGIVETKTFTLPKGAKYTVSLVHEGTDGKYRDTPRPDFDYTLEFSTVNTDADTVLITEDPQGMLGEHWEGTPFFAAGKTATLYTAHITSETDATVPANTKRRKLGVGERATVSVVPAGLTHGVLSLTGSNVGNSTIDAQSGRFRAGYLACSPSITTTIDSKTLQIDFTVIPPSIITFEKVAGSENNHTSPLSVSMEAKIYLGPSDVYFGAITAIQERVVAAVANGYFSGQNGEPHTTINPTGLSSNLVPGKGWELQGIDTISGGTNGPMYQAGTFTWSIPWTYRIGTEEGDIGIADHVKTLVIQPGGKAKLNIIKKQQGADNSRSTETSIIEP